MFTHMPTFNCSNAKELNKKKMGVSMNTTKIKKNTAVVATKYTLSFDF